MPIWWFWWIPIISKHRACQTSNPMYTWTFHITLDLGPEVPLGAMAMSTASLPRGDFTHPEVSKLSGGETEAGRRWPPIGFVRNHSLKRIGVPPQLRLVRVSTSFRCDHCQQIHMDTHMAQQKTLPALDQGEAECSSAVGWSCGGQTRVWLVSGNGRVQATRFKDCWISRCCGLVVILTG